MSWRYFIIGDPVSHSISPCIHNTLFSHYSLDARYETRHVKAGELDLFFLSLRDNYKGGNVTIPHKVSAIDYMDELGDEAKHTGAVNTVTVLKDGRLRGDNTDSAGFLHSLTMELGDSFIEPVAIIGAGGAARGIIYGLISGGTKEFLLINRSLQRAEELSRDMLKLSKGVVIEVSGLNGEGFGLSLERANLVVNASALGLEKDFSSFPFSRLKKGTAVVDIVYKKGGTFLVQEARRRGLTCTDGLPMLAGQAAFAFQYWTGILPDYHLVKDIAFKCLENMEDLSEI